MFSWFVNGLICFPYIVKELFYFSWKVIFTSAPLDPLPPLLLGKGILISLILLFHNRLLYNIINALLAIILQYSTYQKSTKRFYCCSLSSEGAEDVKKEQVRHIDFSEKRIPIKSIIYIYPAKSCASSTDRNTRKKHYQLWLKWWTDVINSRKILIFFFEPQRMVKCTFP